MAKNKGPKFLRFCVPVLEALQEMGGSGNSSEVTDRVIEKMGISEKEQAETLPSGGPRVRNTIGWARFYLLKAGYMEKSRHGVWTLNEKGKNAPTGGFDLEKMLRDARAEFERQKKEEKKDEDSGEDDDEPPAEIEPFADYREQLLDTLKALPPDGFERFANACCVRATSSGSRSRARAGTAESTASASSR